MKSRLRPILTVLVLLAGMIAVFLYYLRTRPHLREPGETERLQQIRALAKSLEDADMTGQRVTPAAVREFFLDYPNVQEPELRLRMAQSLAAQSDPDWLFVADEIEQAAFYTLSHLPPGQVPRRQDFENTGFQFEGWRAWNKPFITDDIDGDGRPDVLFACPGNTQPGVCCLFRQTSQGWVPYRFGIGLPVMGIWVFNIARRGPSAIVLASLADSAYDPNLFLDVFVWQNGRLANVLSTVIKNGWQFKHKDVDRDGTEELLLYAHTSSNHYQQQERAAVTTYKWDGSRFAPWKIEKAPPPQDGSQWLEEGESLFEAGRYRAAAQALQQAAEWKPLRQGISDLDDDDRKTAWYLLGLSRALLGNHTGAVQAMTSALQHGQADDTIFRLAQKFLDACRQPGDLPQALAVIGQVFRVLEVAAQAVRPDASPKEILSAAGFPPDFYQEADLTGSGQSAGLAQIHWTGGSAIVAWQRDPETRRWTLFPLAYALTEKPSSQELNYRSGPGESFYLPRVPALQLQPLADALQVSGIDLHAGSAPQIRIAYQQGADWKDGRIGWDGEQFADLYPPPVPSEDLAAELSRIEAALFERRDYAASLADLDAFVARIRAAPLAAPAKSDLLLEVYYHQALCYRKSGQTARATVLLSALTRGYPDGLSDPQKSAWGELASHWLTKPGE